MFKEKYQRPAVNSVQSAKPLSMVIPNG